jgi:hypothetical protein
MSGSDTPMARSVRKKKNNHRGPRVGSVAKIRINSPKKPLPARMPLRMNMD